MLLTLLYHRVGQGKYATPYSVLEKELRHFSAYPIVTPGDPLRWDRIEICLTFDDATYDFYYYVFPLLKKLKIKAVLSIPAGYILERTSLAPEKRLSVPYSEATQNYLTSAPFCTFEEIEEMVNSGYVIPASHSFSHNNLLLTKELDREILGSKRLLENKLKRPITTFVYPLGQFNSAIHKTVKKYYPYAMRIGSSVNFTWQNAHGLIYRVMSDKALQPIKLSTYLLKYLSNTIRGC